MNPILGVVLILAALAATYFFARAGIQAGATVSAVLGAGIALVQATAHSSVNAKLAARVVPADPRPGAP